MDITVLRQSTLYQLILSPRRWATEYFTFQSSNDTQIAFSVLRYPRPWVSEHQNRTEMPKKKIFLKKFWVIPIYIPVSKRCRQISKLPILWEKQNNPYWQCSIHVKENACFTRFYRHFALLTRFKKSCKLKALGTMIPKFIRIKKRNDIRLASGCDVTAPAVFITDF